MNSTRSRPENIRSTRDKLWRIYMPRTAQGWTTKIAATHVPTFALCRSQCSGYGNWGYHTDHQ